MSETIAAQAIVVGAGPGLGRALALTFARNHLDIGLVARGSQGLDKVANEIQSMGRVARTATADAFDPDTIGHAVRSLASAAPVTILAYNIGVDGGSLLSNDIAALRRYSDANVHAAVVAVQAGLPALRESKGTILLTGGGSALHPSAAYGVLALGKSALRAVAFALADELKPLGIRVRTLTISGVIAPDTAFDPERIAAAFWDFAGDASEDVERVYNGK